MSAITIKPATATDADTLLALISALADYENLDPPDAGARARLKQHIWGEQPRAEVVLAWQGDTAVGYAFWFETYSTFLAKPTLYLEDIFVLPGARGQGAGKALFDHCLAEARRRDCGRMEWAVLTWNQPAIDFYEQRYGARRLEDWRTYRLEPVPELYSLPAKS